MKPDPANLKAIAASDSTTAMRNALVTAANHIANETPFTKDGEHFREIARKLLPVSREAYEALYDAADRLEVAQARVSELETVPCDFCDGRGFHEQHDDRPFIDETVRVPCCDCHGEGRVRA